MSLELKRELAKDEPGPSECGSYLLWGLDTCHSDDDLQNISENEQEESSTPLLLHQSSTPMHPSSHYAITKLKTYQMTGHPHHRLRKSHSLQDNC